MSEIFIHMVKRLQIGKHDSVFLSVTPDHWQSVSDHLTMSEIFIHVIKGITMQAMSIYSQMMAN